MRRPAPIGAWLRDIRAQRRVGCKACACGEKRPFALLPGRSPPLCYRCERFAQGREPYERNHVFGKANSALTIRYPINDHRAVFSVKQYRWPPGALENPNGSPLLEGGRAAPGTEVLCVNPTLAEQDGQAGDLLPYAPTARGARARNQAQAPQAPTPWVEEVGLVTARCEHENGASWLQISPPEGVSADVIADRAAHHEQVQELLGPEWGLHVDDVNEALGNLVGMVAAEAARYRRLQRANLRTARTRGGRRSPHAACQAGVFGARAKAATPPSPSAGVLTVRSRPRALA